MTEGSTTATWRADTSPSRMAESKAFRTWGRWRVMDSSPPWRSRSTGGPSSTGRSRRVAPRRHLGELRAGLQQAIGHGLGHQPLGHRPVLGAAEQDGQRDRRQRVGLHRGQRGGQLGPARGHHDIGPLGSTSLGIGDHRHHHGGDHRQSALWSGGQDVGEGVPLDQDRPALEPYNRLERLAGSEHRHELRSGEPHGVHASDGNESAPPAWSDRAREDRRGAAVTLRDVDHRPDDDPAAAWARSGMLSLTGRPDREPLGAPRALVDGVRAWADELAARSAALGDAWWSTRWRSWPSGPR